MREGERIVHGLSDADLLADEDEISRSFAQIAAGLSHVREFWIVDAQGKALVSSAANHREPSTSLAQSDAFQGALKDGGLYIGRVEKAPRTGEELFTVSLKVVAPNGAPRVLMASLAPDVIEDFLKKVMVNQAAIARSDGRMLARLPKFPGGLTDAPKAVLLLSQLEGGGPKDEGIVGFAASADGTLRRTAYKHVADYPLYVLSGVEKGTVVSQAIRTMASHLIFGIPATLSLIALSFLAWRSARSLARRKRHEGKWRRSCQRPGALRPLGSLQGV